MIYPLNKLQARVSSDAGFTMIIALGVMLVTSLLLVAGYTAVTGDAKLSSNEIIQKQAAYAAVAGVQEYEYQLQSNPDYWETCKTPENIVPQETTAKETAYNGHYVIKLLPASTAPKGTTGCSTSNPFGTMIQSGGSLANTFRIESIGYAGTDKRTLIATFHVIGFLNYVYFTQYEVEDPSLDGDSTTECEKYYVERTKTGAECQTILFGKEDSVNGPMHTDDAANVTCSKELNFGREGDTDAVEINGGTWPTCSKSSEPTYNDPTKKPTVGTELVAPQSDTSLLAYVEEENKFTGVTHLVLNGTTNEITAKYYVEEKGVEKEVKETIEWPKNGLIYVQAGKNCSYTFKPTSADTTTEEKEEINCGTVYVSGTYSQPLTIAAQNNLIINGSISPTSVSKLGSAPSGTTTLGLIATEYIRIYHPCGSKGNETGSLENPWIYAALLSTSHSFIVDNFNCGKNLGELNVYGAIAQKFRGPVGLASGQGYNKDYIYDERLATDEPPYFLSPLNAGWQIERETAPTEG